MATNIHQPQEQTSVAENAATLRSQRQETMMRLALRSSETVTPSATPSQKDVKAWENKNGNLSEAVREQWNVPQEETTKAKASLQDVQSIGQSFQTQGVTTNEVSQANSKARIENSFDSPQRTGSTVNQAKSLSETDKVTAQAKQSVQKDNSKSQSVDWER